MSADTGLALVPPSASPALLRPIAKPADFIAVHTETAALIRDALQEGQDYGKIPGTAKNTLLKPGAERLCLAFGLRAAFEIMEQEVDHDRANPHKGNQVSYGLYRYVVRCVLHGPDGREVGQGIGSCSTLESKYVSRPRDSENTALKMAKKRALVDGVLSTLGLSDRFTQDVEDVRDDEGAAHEATTQAGAPASYLDLTRDVTMQEQAEATAFAKSVGMDGPGLARLKAATTIDWRFVALEGRRLKVATFGAILALVATDRAARAAAGAGRHPDATAGGSPRAGSVSDRDRRWTPRSGHCCRDAVGGAGPAGGAAGQMTSTTTTTDGSGPR